MKARANPDTVGGLALLALAIFYVNQSLGLASAGPVVATMRSESGVGEGFFPFWIGAGLIVGALLLTARGIKAGERPAAESAGRQGKVFVLLGTIFVTVFAMDKLGLVISSFAFVAVFAWLLGSRWYVGATFSLILTVLVHVIFVRWLGVPLPVGPLGF